jgi:hypothetical protein
LYLSPVFILALLPLATLNANPGNLVKNGDFSDGSSNWVDNGSVSYNDSTVSIGPGESSWIQQNINLPDFPKGKPHFEADLK